MELCGGDTDILRTVSDDRQLWTLCPCVLAICGANSSPKLAPSSGLCCGTRIMHDPATWLKAETRSSWPGITRQTRLFVPFGSVIDCCKQTISRWAFVVGSVACAGKGRKKGQPNHTCVHTNSKHGTSVMTASLLRESLAFLRLKQPMIKECPTSPEVVAEVHELANHEGYPFEQEPESAGLAVVGP